MEKWGSSFQDKIAVYIILIKLLIVFIIVDDDWLTMFIWVNHKYLYFFVGFSGRAGEKRRWGGGWCCYEGWAPAERGTSSRTYQWGCPAARRTAPSSARQSYQPAPIYPEKCPQGCLEAPVCLAAPAAGRCQQAQPPC